jgi:phosphohistidine phosphatase
MPGPYQLYLIRHGIAEERGEQWPDDTKRPLTEEGMLRLRRSARGLDRVGITFDVILTSPLVRARQTAEIVGGEINPVPQIVNVPSLAPGGSHQAVLNDIEKQNRRERIALVGHEPGMGELLARLIGTRHAIEFKKGAVCRVDVDALPPTAPGDLRWFLTPRLSRSLRK